METSSPEVTRARSAGLQPATDQVELDQDLALASAQFIKRMSSAILEVDEQAQPGGRLRPDAFPHQKLVKIAQNGWVARWVQRLQRDQGGLQLALPFFGRPVGDALDDTVETRYVTAAGEDADASCSSHRSLLACSLWMRPQAWMDRLTRPASGR